MQHDLDEHDDRGEHEQHRQHLVERPTTRRPLRTLAAGQARGPGQQPAPRPRPPRPARWSGWPAARRARCARAPAGPQVARASSSDSPDWWWPGTRARRRPPRRPRSASGSASANAAARRTRSRASAVSGMSTTAACTTSGCSGRPEISMSRTLGQTGPSKRLDAQLLATSQRVRRTGRRLYSRLSGSRCARSPGRSSAGRPGTAPPSARR